MTDKSLHEAIQNLAYKKHVLSDEAVKAKEELKDYKFFSSGDPKASKQHMNVIREFNDSIDLLYGIFHKSHFDEMALLLARPARVFMLNFFIGLIRGIGFMIGILLVAGLIAFLMKDAFSATLSFVLP